MKCLKIAVLAAATFAIAWAGTAAAEDTAYIPTFVYRTGAYAPNGIPIANGFKDYFTLLNERDGGIEGVKIVHEECETNYDTKLGVECYERLKSKNPLVINPFSTGITYALIPRARVDKIPILSMGYGRTDVAVGSVFPWVFNAPTGYWSQASAFIKYVGSKEGGLDKLKGKNIALVYHNSPYGKEPIPTLEALAEKYGYELELLAVDHPGQEQKSTLGKGAATWDEVGTVLYNRALVNAMMTTEAIRDAIKKHGKTITGEQTREGLENLNLTEDRLSKLGFGGMTKPIKITCNDHEGNGPVLIQQWDGKEWKIVSDWIEPMRDVVRPMMEASAKKFADENKIAPRQCPSS